jgi:hypothetical protein
MTNKAWREELAQNPRRPKYMLGQNVVDNYGRSGCVHSIYAGLQAVENVSLGFGADAWYDGQERPPVTPFDGIWYGVVLDDGDVLVGEDDILMASEVISRRSS